MKIINPIKIINKKGNILKYKLNHYFFKKKIRDFYFTEIKKNHSKGWKIKDRNTVLIVVSGEIKVETVKRKVRFKKIFKSTNKQIIIIPKKTYFKLTAHKKKSELISLLNEIY